jgi:hypothetical protein
MADLIALLMLTLSAQLKPGASETQIEAKIAALVKQEQPAPHEGIKVDASGVSAKGCSSITFSFDGLLLDPVLLKSADITVSEVKKGTDGKLSIAGIEWSADIGEQELTAALQQKVEKFKETTIDINPAGLTLSGRYPLLFGATVSYSVSGEVIVEDETLLMFYIDKSKVSGVGLPKGLNKKIEKEVNPVYDLAKFRAKSEKEIRLAKEQLSYDFNLLIVTITPQDGHIIVSGTA